MLQRLVDSASSFVYNYLSLDTFAKSQYDEMYDGTGGAFMVLRQQPACRSASSLRCTVFLCKRSDGRRQDFTFHQWL
jgi:hypothetical protein